MKVMIIDITKCNGCYNCQIACKDEHVGNDWTPIAKPQPDTGAFWNKVEEKIRGTVPKVKMAYMHHMCQHCKEAPCLKACKTKAIYKREDGAVIIDPEKCRSQKNCIEACPYGVIYFNEGLQIAQKCTWCAHLLDKGWKEPRCVDACPTGALRFGEESEFRDLIAKAEILKPETGAEPRTYYIGIPKRFIAGAIFDPIEDEVIEKAKVKLVGSGKEKVEQSLYTDEFGDFWFENLAVGIYKVSIEKEGYKTKTIDSINTDKDVNLGDIELEKK
jgi:tetrathionate reductase subunit B